METAEPIHRRVHRRVIASAPRAAGRHLLAEPESRPNLPGKVHTGFFDATLAIITAIANEVLRLNPAGSKRVYVTGHSLGGPMASIGAYIMQAAPYDIRIEQVVTFASPKPRDSAFQAACQKIFPTQIRYETTTIWCRCCRQPTT